ncbi:hypothetical protein GQ55_6G263200 [Panicum hallii var. hallii]|uniref:Proteasome subunit beta type-1 n=1 Tax=Panicum hallii var. hallii TaxID=1504633 RepID=A0A2T7D9W5_9POAL|nr:hypothetical protein GQ55_6G263200 [Panicum hallii var. hallii]
MGLAFHLFGLCRPKIRPILTQQSPQSAGRNRPSRTLFLQHKKIRRRTRLPRRAGAAFFKQSEPSPSPTALRKFASDFWDQTRERSKQTAPRAGRRRVNLGAQAMARFDPYENNGGTCVAVAGADYCVVAADTRLSVGYSILSRDHSKIAQLADKCVLASSGFQGDIKALQKNLAAKELVYEHNHNKKMSCPAMAQLLSNTLYYKRFFPYYAFNVLGGLDSQGKGCVFTYDAVGSYERTGYSAQGTGAALMMPVLDNQLKSPSPLLLPARDAVTPLSESEAVDLVKDVFASATERDIYTGDRLEIVVINSSGTHREYIELRKD